MAGELKSYQCHKKVKADKIISWSTGDGGGGMLIALEHGLVVLVDTNWVARNPQPRVGGYYVEYEDGYTSYSPAKAFEEGYTLIA